jgi:GntR family transcriptional regulator
MPFTPDISTGSAVPIYRQLIDQVRLGIATGRLSAGDQLPSVRALAERLLVNPNTIAKAYAELAREKVIETQQGRGVFIALPRQMYTATERARRLTPLLDALVNEGVALGYSPDELGGALQEALRQRMKKLKISESVRSA